MDAIIALFFACISFLQECHVILSDVRDGLLEVKEIVFCKKNVTYAVTITGRIILINWTFSTTYIIYLYLYHSVCMCECIVDGKVKVENAL